MSDMKCPICGTPLEYDIGYDGDCFCAKCGKAKFFGSEELWQALTDSIKEYDLCHDALVERTKELDRTRKALEIAKTHLGYIKNNYHSWTPYRDEQMIAQASNCLAKIKELEDGNL